MQAKSLPLPSKLGEVLRHKHWSDCNSSIDHRDVKVSCDGGVIKKFAATNRSSSHCCHKNEYTGVTFYAKSTSLAAGSLPVGHRNHSRLGGGLSTIRSTLKCTNLDEPISDTILFVVDFDIKKISHVYRP